MLNFTLFDHQPRCILFPGSIRVGQDQVFIEFFCMLKAHISFKREDKDIILKPLNLGKYAKVGQQKKFLILLC